MLPGLGLALSQGKAGTLLLRKGKLLLWLSCFPN